MVFNSGVFVFFFCCVLLVYWSLLKLKNGTRIQNRFLLCASYFFYGYWDWLFLTLIVFSTIVDYFSARGIERNENSAKRKSFLLLSVFVNIGLLASFKYFDFFTLSFVSMVRSIYPSAFPDGGESLLLNVILPVGISFYTFQTMSYTIDVYRKLIPAERNFLDFALFVSFFPQLVAGPIERASHLLPQIKNRRIFTADNMAKGAWLILLGFFMKTYVADNLAPLVNQVYMDGRSAYLADPLKAQGHGGYQVMIASVGFFFQIYCDFAGYSSIALGTARMLGIKLSTNFNIPEMSQNPVEFWRRWHITLNRWVTDYIYISLGGGRIGKIMRYRNLLIAFLLMGLWHGANWTFILWGLFHGILMILHGLLHRFGPKLPETLHPLLKNCVSVIKMFAVLLLFSLSAVFFRAYDLNHALLLYKSIFEFPWNMHDSINQVAAAGPYTMAIFNKIAILLMIDLAAYLSRDVFWIFKSNLWLRVTVYFALFYGVIVLGFFGKDVIYFAF